LVSQPSSRTSTSIKIIIIIIIARIIIIIITTTIIASTACTSIIPPPIKRTSYLYIALNQRIVAGGRNSI